MESQLSTALLDHARRYLWANPGVDSQAIFKLNRLSRHGGTHRRIDVAGREVPFPTPHAYLVYSLSALPERWFGVTRVIPPMRWQPATELMNSANVLFQFYNTRGAMVPMANIYFYKQVNNNILIAIKLDRRLPDIDDGLYFRTYTNAITIERISPYATKVGQVLALQIKNDDDITRVAQQRQLWEGKSNVEQTMLFVNGVLRRHFANTELKPGDYVDLVWDDTIKAVREVDIDPTRTYESIKDQCVKYIISRGKDNGRLDYFDDVDFFLYDSQVDEGYYYHRNTGQSVRQLTHGDYGLPAWAIHSYLNFDENNIKRPNTKMVLYTRNTIGDPQISNVHNRLTTLYRLPEEDIRLELASPVGQLPEWQAKHLEEAAFNQVVNAPTRDLDPDHVRDGYGYHGIVDAIGKMLFRPKESLLTLPPLYQQGGLAVVHFEKDIEFTPILKGTTKLTWGNRVPKLVYLIAGELSYHEDQLRYPIRWYHPQPGLWYQRKQNDPEAPWTRITDDQFIQRDGEHWNINADQNRYYLAYRTGEEILYHRHSMVNKDNHWDTTQVLQASRWSRVIGTPFGVTNSSDPELALVPTKIVSVHADNEVEYDIFINESGRYEIAGMILAPNGTSDSFFMALDGADLERWDTGQHQTYTKRVWNTVELTAGKHTLRVKTRETGTQCSAWLIERVDSSIARVPTISPLIEFTLPTHFWGWRHVDVYLGHRKLIPDLEYHLKQNRIQYLGSGIKAGVKLVFHVVAYGLAPEGYQTNMDLEVGFTINNCISYGNGRFLLTDRHPLINVGGNLFLKHEVDWHELSLNKPVPNALPYAIETKYPNIQCVCKENMDSLLSRSLELDVRLKSYLDMKYPLPKNNDLNLAVKPMVVVSAFLAWVYHHRKTILFGMSEWVPMSQLKTKLDKVFALYDHDICLANIDFRYVRVRLHGFGEDIQLPVTEKEYDLLDKVNQYYLKGRIQLNESVVIRSEA